MRERLVPIFALTVILAVTLVGCSGGQTSVNPSPLAALTAAAGDVSLMKGNAGSWAVAQVGVSLKTGDGVKTGDNSTAEITFLDGSTIELEANTEIDIVSLEISSETGSKIITLNQIIGDTISRVTHLVDSESSYEIDTPGGTAGVRGSVMLVHVGADGTTLVTNQEGNIYVRGQGVEIDVPVGHSCIVEPGQPPQLVYNLTVASTVGGRVTAPGEETFAYNAGAVVSLNAVPYSGYTFVNWTGDVSEVGNLTAPSTTITMNDDYSITANFIQGQPIRTWFDLDGVRNDLAGTYVLMNNLDSATDGYDQLASSTANDGRGWLPIGGPDAQFTGIFNGLGHAIEDLSINRPLDSYVGLFSYVYSGGVVKNIGVTNVAVTGDDSVGGLVGYNEGGSVSNSYSTGTVSSTSGCAGGLVGVSRSNGSVSTSYSTSTVIGVSSVGGLVGEDDDTSTLNNCYSTGSVSASSDAIGGLVGYCEGIVYHCYSTGSVTGGTSVGGLVGNIDDTGTANNSFWDMQTSGIRTSACGIGELTAEMRAISTFSGADWDIVAVQSGQTDPAHTWNIVNNAAYPFLSWQ
jgi:hypothetical protein